MPKPNGSLKPDGHSQSAANHASSGAPAACFAGRAPAHTHSTKTSYNIVGGANDRSCGPARDRASAACEPSRTVAGPEPRDPGLLPLGQHLECQPRLSTCSGPRQKPRTSRLQSEDCSVAPFVNQAIAPRAAPGVALGSTAGLEVKSHSVSGH